LIQPTAKVVTVDVKPDVFGINQMVNFNAF